MNELRVTQLHTQEEFDGCVALQQATWQYSAGEILPRRVFFLADKLGGHVLGAWDGAKLVGFNLGLPAQRNGMGYIHSQMLAVLPEYRNSGLGRAMKMEQREIALQQGIKLIEWTYDPLEIKNSFFNLSRLGAITRRYIPDFYGASSSPLQGGLPTDRLYAEWWIDSDHAKSVMARAPMEPKIETTVRVPAQIYAWKADGDKRATEAQEAVRVQLQNAFAAGLVALGYQRAEDGSGLFLLGHLEREVPSTDAR